MLKPATITIINEELGISEEIYNSTKSGTKAQNFPCGEFNFKLTDSKAVNHLLHKQTFIEYFYNGDNASLLFLSAFLNKLDKHYVNFINLVIPYLPAGRNDKNDSSIFDLGYVLKLMRSSLDREIQLVIFSDDLHNLYQTALIINRLNDFYTIYNTELQPFSEVNTFLTSKYNFKVNYNKDVCIVCPDNGAKQRVKDFVEANFNSSYEYKNKIVFTKFRSISEVKIEDVDLTNYKPAKEFLIIDDICDGGATFINIAKWIKENLGQDSKIHLWTTHGFYTKGLDVFSDFESVNCRFNYSNYDLSTI